MADMLASVVSGLSGALPAGTLDAPSGAAPSGEGAAAGFTDALASLVGNADATSTQANTAVSAMLDGSGDVHSAMIALQRAEIALQLTVQVRNKLVQAYQDIMRMPV